MIEFRNVNLSFIKDYYELYNVSFKIEKNDKVVIIGDENSGNSFILKVIAGLEKFNSGQVLFNERDIEKVSFSKDINLGYISYEGLFLNNKTVEQNLRYICKIRKIKNCSEEIYKVLSEFKLLKVKNVKVKKLSQMQKVLLQFARINVRKPRIVLLDNIFKNLNNHNKETLLEIVRTMCEKEPEKTIILASACNYLDELFKKKIKMSFGSIID